MSAEVEVRTTHHDRFETLEEAIDFVKTHAPTEGVPFTVYIATSALGEQDGKWLSTSVSVTVKTVGSEGGSDE